MSKILYIADFSENTNRLFDKISQIRQTKFIDYNLDHLTSFLNDENPELIIISVSRLEYEKEHVLNLILQIKPELNYVLYGSKEECHDFYGKFKANIIKFIVTPITKSDFIKEIQQIVNRLEGFTGYAEDGKKSALDSAKEPSKSDKKSILLVDDDVVLLRTMMNYLKDLYTVSVAKSGTEALTLLGSIKPDLILLDFEMPVVSGPDTMKMIRSEEKLKEIPIMFLTGVSDPEHVKDALVLKPEGYILKTQGQTEILARIKDFFLKQSIPAYE
ncbi:response regulator [Treponema sp.]|uniref:response regulator n=1 Tax=Treponema sp. TaxID=166 RepID=UPI00298DEFD3|nr:response regulator [Treponema sp.]MCR5612637.1 response regulator [Treponema sp.]